LELKQYIDNFFSFVSSKNVNHFLVFRQSAANNFQIVFALWILGISIVGIPIILLLIFLKGFTIGFTVGFIMNEMGAKGILFSLISIIPQNLLVLPALIIIAAIGINFSIRILKNRAFKKGIVSEIMLYSVEVFTVSAAILLGSIIEGYIVPFLIKIYAIYF